jgi:hypothetical protein
MPTIAATPGASKLAAPDVIRRRVKVPTGTCKLSLAINGTAYNVRPLPVDQDAATRAFRLRKADGTAYDVARTVHGSECSCPDWIFNRDGKDVNGCKHIKAMKACGLL